jgi:hypothetical protein
MSPLFFKIANAIMPPISQFLCAPAGHGRTGKIESQNKIKTIERVEITNQLLGGNLTIGQMVEKIGAEELFRSLWLAEGLGQHYGNRMLAQSAAPRDILTTGEGPGIPEDYMLMVHAGMALAFARHHWDRIGKNASDGQIGDAVRRIADLVIGNAIPGYAGISYEAWGMVTRFFYKGVFVRAAEALGKFDEPHVANFWHGAGRAVYFYDFMPKWKEPWPVFARIDRENVGPVSRLNLFAGLGSVTVIVNMRSPDVLETLVRERVAKRSGEEIEAYSQGIACSMVMRQDTTRNEENALNLLKYRPSAGMEEMWEKVVAGPARLALHTLHPMLRGERRLDEITRYQPLAEIMARSSSGRGA